MLKTIKPSNNHKINENGYSNAKFEGFCFVRHKNNSSYVKIITENNAFLLSSSNARLPPVRSTSERFTILMRPV